MFRMKMMPSGQSFAAFLIFLCGVCLSTPSLTQPIVAPGDISRQVEPVRVPALPTLQDSTQRITQPSLPEAGSTMVRVQQWVLQGNHLLDDATLRNSLQPFTGVDLSLQQIREAAAVVQQAYDDAGWLARVDVPAQDVTEGRITLLITEALLGEVRLDAQAVSRVRPERLQAWVMSTQANGQPLNTHQLNRSLLLVDDLPGVSVSGALQASSWPGATDVILSAVAEQPFNLDLGLDNYNARTVGASRMRFSGIWNSPAGIGENYRMQAFKSEGSEYLGLGANVPLGYDGLRAGMNVSRLDYEIITPDADGRRQDIHGRSESAVIDLNMPLLRSRQVNWYVNAALEQRRYLGYANGQRSSHYSIDSGQIGVAANFFDQWGGGAANSLRINLRHGDVQAGLVPVLSTVEGSFKKIHWTLSRQQALHSNLSLLVTLSGQNTGSKVLDGSENFSLGGPYGVRAYPVSEGTGPQGRVFNLDLRYRVHPQWLATLFYDQGQIEKRTTDPRSFYRLEGAGLQLDWTGPDGWSARATVAQRLGSNPNAIADTGRDQDGSFIKNRVWLTLSRSI
jgi:hemolysin activation/secretion protein